MLIVFQNRITPFQLWVTLAGVNHDECCRELYISISSHRIPSLINLLYATLYLWFFIFDLDRLIMRDSAFSLLHLFICNAREDNLNNFKKILNFSPGGPPCDIDFLTNIRLHSAIDRAVLVSSLTLELVFAVTPASLACRFTTIIRLLC